MAKGKIKALYFWASWDRDFYKKLDDFKNECKLLKLPNATIDVETEEGVEASITYGIRNVPAIVVLKGNKVVGIERGNNGYENLCKYVR